MALLTAARSVSRCITGRGRRCVTSCVPTEEIEKKKSIYVCFEEIRSRSNRHNARRVVRSFDEGYCLNADAEMLKLVAFNRARDQNMLSCHRPWVCIGDNILQYKGRNRIQWLNTVTNKFEKASRRKTRIKNFPNDKCNFNWGEIDGKLYCIDNNKNYQDKTQERNLFEVLDLENDTDWNPLPDPPYIQGQGATFEDHSALFSSGSKKILGWERDIPGTFAFDVTKPESGWKELSYDIRPHGPRPLLIHQKNHPQLGDFHLLFTYSHVGENPLVVFPFYMSNDCQSFRPIHNFPVELPESCSHYLPDRDGRVLPISELELLYINRNYTLFEFVNLGNERFGFLLHKYPYTGPNIGPRSKEDPETTGGLLYLTFKYDVVKVNDALEIRSRLIGSRHMRYHAHYACNITMNGAFFI